MSWEPALELVGNVTGVLAVGGLVAVIVHEARLQRADDRAARRRALNYRQQQQPEEQTE